MVARGTDRSRLRVLLSDGESDWAEQLPRLLEPQGVRAVRVGNVEAALEAIERGPVHAAVVALDLPGASGRSGGGLREHRLPGGLRLLRVIHRLERRPPAVVVRGRAFHRLIDDHLLQEALRLGAFSVMDQPVRIEQLLRVLRRLIERHYGGHWPEDGPADAEDSEDVLET